MRPAERGRLGAAAAVEMSGPPGLRRAGRRGPGGGSLGSTATDGVGTDAAEGVVGGAAGNATTTTDVATTER
jgi:hypothetical protein